MPEIIQDWLGTRLGVLVDISPEKFGRNTKDGKLLAKLLHNYGVIPTHILDKVKESKNYYECYNNLVALKPWLKCIGVIHEDAILQKMAGGEGSAAISVFYSLYLNLERKDRLHYLSAQKERRISEFCQKFQVSWVPEGIPVGASGDTVPPLATPLWENFDMIQWHKAKCDEVVKHIRKVKANARKVLRQKQKLGPPLTKKPLPQPMDKRELEAEETRREILEFEKKHTKKSPDLNFSELTEMQNFSDVQSSAGPCMAEAKNFVSNIKRRKKADTYARDFQQKMQNILLEEQWKEIIDNQEKEFESKVCTNLLKQSQYEKQMANKLHLIRNQKKVLVENRKKIESLKIDLFQREYEEVFHRNLEVMGEYWNDEEFEKERIEELHRRLYDEKARIRREMNKTECQKICEALVDIAIRISEFRDLIGCQIPKSFMKTLKELFFKDLPIFDLLDHQEDICLKNSQISVFGEYQSTGGTEFEGEDEFYQIGAFDRLKREEESRQSILNSCDFNDYMELAGPWMVELLFPDGRETEVKHLVLGYIVHKILAVKYPSSKASVPVYIKPMRPTAMLHGLTDETAVNMLKDLMEACGILVVRVNDAINFVLSAYKEELSVVRDIDLNFQKITEQALQPKNSTGNEKLGNKKSQLLKVETPKISESEVEFETLDKETQTPRMIPEDDPLLSRNAGFGKQAFEALGAGDPVPDPVIAAAVVAYVTSKQQDYTGWVLLNYPVLYAQASELEYYLTGYRTLPVIEDVETLEDAEGFSYRGDWGNSFTGDILNENRVSKLVPKPEILDPSLTVIPKTYFDSLFKLKKSAGTPRRGPQGLEEFGPMEEFYQNLGVLYNFEYEILNFQTMKNLGKEILLKGIPVPDDVELGEKSSVEIFGSIVLELGEKWEPKRKVVKVPTKKSHETKNMLDETVETVKETEEEMEGFEEDKVVEASAPPQPGDPTWEWATGTLPETLMVALAGLWENMEAVYIEDFKNLFFALRAHRSNTIDYCGFIRRSLRTLMRRPDEKQTVLENFQRMFNEIDEDLRPDVDIKCELHVRVSELEQSLMCIADERKQNSLKDMSKVAQDCWVPDEMANLVNIFLNALQLEADRSFDSCQVIMDYYFSLQQKLPDVKPLVKLIIPKLMIQDRKYSMTSSISSKTLLSPRGTELRRSLKSEQGKLSKTRNLGDKKRRNSDSGLQGAAEFINDILANLTLPQDGLTPFHTFIMDSVQSMTTEIRNILESCILEAKKSEKGIESTARQTKRSKKPSETNIPSVNDNLITEWVTALENELSRFVFRSQLLLARAIYDLNEFLAMILNILSSLTEEITEMYLKEIDSISECCKVFRCAIEKEIQIKPILKLKEDEFSVYMESEVPSEEEIPNVNAPEEQDKISFTMEQLNLLFHKLQRVAPSGEIVKRSLLYIFEDLRMLNPEVENCRCFPEIWNLIEPDDVTTIIDEVYQDLEIVHWKDFIIYALELPLPTEMEVLSMRQLFRKFDPHVTELITREKYNCVTLWFEQFSGNFNDKIQQAKDLLYRMYQVDEVQMNYSALLLAFCKDENPVLGFEKALSLAMGKQIQKYSPSDMSLMGEMDSFGSGLFEESNRMSYNKSYCCPTTSTEATIKCIPKEKITRCECKHESESLVEDSTSEQEMNFPENVGEDQAMFFYPKIIQDTIPLNILSSLLKASFPALPQLSILLDCQQTFQETLNTIYDSFESCDNTVQVQKLLNHKFIHRLLHSTNKFKFVNLKPILLSLTKLSGARGQVQHRKSDR